MDEFTNVAEAFNRKSLIYDDFERDHIHVEYMRCKVRDHALSFLKAGDAILEINAGTGADAVFFAQQGYRVHAIDLSPGMVSKIREKIERSGLQERFTVQQCSFTELDNFVEGPFDFIFSNMGGVNCLADPGRITRSLPGLLLPGGYVTWVVMPPICPWELFGGLRGRFKTARRRLSKSGVLAHMEGIYFRAYYFTPGQIIRAFGKSFQPIRLEGLSVFTPTADNASFAKRFPKIYRWLRFLDENLSGRFPFNHWGDFFILTMKYLP